jgi:hypothetical protein
MPSLVGFEIVGRVDAEHRDRRVVYRVIWVDAEE